MHSVQDYDLDYLGVRFDETNYMNNAFVALINSVYDGEYNSQKEIVRNILAASFDAL